ncbi:MAG: hypothetical protein ABMB14_32980, partial [Myxococcota bacterium]
MWWIAAAEAATLAEAWDAAGSSSPDLRAARAEADAVTAGRGQAWARLAPKLAVSASGTVTDEAVVLDLGAALPPTAAAAIGPIPPLEVSPQAWWQVSATLVVPV